MPDQNGVLIYPAGKSLTQEEIQEVLNRGVKAAHKTSSDADRTDLDAEQEARLIAPYDPEASLRLRQTFHEAKSIVEGSIDSIERSRFRA